MMKKKKKMMMMMVMKMKVHDASFPHLGCEHHLVASSSGGPCLVGQRWKSSRGVC